MADFGGLPWFEAVVEGVDREGRLLRLRAVNPENRTAVQFKDDTIVDTTSGARVRLDDYLDSNSNRFPFGLGDRIQLSWRQNPTTKAPTAVVIVRVRK
jgi:hypothetical protein